MSDFNIHNILKVRSNIFNLVPHTFKTDHIDEPDLLIHLGDFDLNSIYDSMYDSMCYEHTWQKVFRTKFLMTDLLGKTKVMYNSPRYKYLKRVRKQIITLIDAVIRLKFLQRGYSLIHGACLEKDGRGIFLSAPAETGKTYTAITLVKNFNFNYLSDDQTLINGNEAYSYPTRITLHTYHIKFLGLDLGLKRRIELAIRDKLTSLPFISISGIEFTISPEFIIPKSKIVDKTKIEYIYLMELGKEEELKEIDKDSALRKIKVTGRAHESLYENELLMDYFLKNPSIPSLENFLDERKKIFERLINNTKCFLVRSKTRSYSNLIIRSLRK